MGRIGHPLDIVTSVVSSMPVVGGRIAEFIADQVAIDRQGEGDFAVQWVETHEERGGGR